MRCVTSIVVADLAQPVLAVRRIFPIELMDETKPLMAAGRHLLLKEGCFFSQCIRFIADDADPSIGSDIHSFSVDDDIVHVVAWQPMVRPEIVKLLANVANCPFCGT